MTWAAYGRRIRQMTASGGTTCPSVTITPSTFPQVRVRLTLVMISEVFTFRADLGKRGLAGGLPTG